MPKTKVQTLLASNNDDIKIYVIIPNVVNVRVETTMIMIYYRLMMRVDPNRATYNLIKI